VRTLAAGQPAYNASEYHNGTVWPHDNAFIAAGLTLYGRRAEVGIPVAQQ
jgi:glycogen debranching enzyme